MNQPTEKGYLNHILVEDGKLKVMQEMPEKPNVWQESPGDEELYQKLLSKAKSEAVEVADEKNVRDFVTKQNSDGNLLQVFSGIYPIVTPNKFRLQWQCRLIGQAVWEDSFCSEHDREQFSRHGFEYRQVAYYREPSEQPKYFLCDACVGTGMNPKMSTTQSADSPYCPYCDGLGWVPESNYKSPNGEPSEQHPEGVCPKCGKPNDAGLDKCLLCGFSFVADEQHPEDTCQKCGGPNVLWYAESELFNKVNGSPNGIICPKCFIKMASEQGESIIFKAVRIKGEPSEQPAKPVRCVDQKNDPRWWIKNMADLDHAAFIIKRRIIENILAESGVVADKDYDTIAEKILFDLSQCEPSEQPKFTHQATFELNSNDAKYFAFGAEGPKEGTIIIDQIYKNGKWEKLQLDDDAIYLKGWYTQQQLKSFIKDEPKVESKEVKFDAEHGCTPNLCTFPNCECDFPPTIIKDDKQTKNHGA